MINFKTALILTAVAVLGAPIALGLASPDFKGPVAHVCSATRTGIEMTPTIFTPTAVYSALMDCEREF